MSVDVDLLRAYVDGELPPLRRAEVEAAAAASEELAHALETMFGSRLPYRSAYAEAADAPVPAALEARVSELANVAEASHGLALAGAGFAGTSRTGPGADRRVVWALLLLVGLLAGLLLAMRSGGVTQPVVEPWVLRVGSYHSMYSRETLADDGSGPAQGAAFRQRLQDRQGLDLRIPDLSAEGLRFVRAQQLQFDGQLVIQLVYLPKTGAPVALCLTRRATQPEREVWVDGLHAVTWLDHGWAYVLVGEQPTETLQRVRQKIPSVVA